MERWNLEFGPNTKEKFQIGKLTEKFENSRGSRVLWNGCFDCDDTCGQKFSKRQTLHQMSKVIQTFKGRKPLTNRFPLLCTLFYGFQSFRKVPQIHEAHDFMQYKYINQYFSKREHVYGISMKSQVMKPDKFAWRVWLDRARGDDVRFCEKFSTARIKLAAVANTNLIEIQIGALTFSRLSLNTK